MWTPKRVLLLAVGFAFFLTAFIVYAYFLGRFDGLRPLPEAYLPRAAEEHYPTPPPTNATSTEVIRKLERAFGEGCPEIKRGIKLQIPSRRIVLAADRYKIEDGRVQLLPLSLAIFGKEAGPEQVPEINTIRCDQAFLTFDRPISSLAEIGSQKIVALELNGDPKQHADRGDPGGVTLVNNRRSAQRGNELTVFTPGPIYYDEKMHKIWTKESVHVRDLQSKPKPTEITAIGMDVYLAAEESPRPPGARAADPHKAKLPTVGGVDRVCLRHDVDMYLWVDGRSGFLGTVKEEPPRKQEAAASPSKSEGPPRVAQPGATPPPEKALVVISTQGPFEYDLRTDRARFDILQRNEQRRPDQVLVTRRSKPDSPDNQQDQLVCEHLELQFHRKAAGPAPAGKTGTAATHDDRSVELEMQSAHAWADSGREVVLTSDAEVLTAFGSDLVYDAARHQTTLKGNPKISVLKDGNQIDAVELLLIGMGQKEGQQARIKGPGEIGMLDATSKQRTLHARWKDTLVSSKEGAFDVLLLTGDATFEDADKEHPQQLQADQLKVWLQPGEEKSGKKPPTGSGNESRHRPHHLEAIGNVQARSLEMNVHHTERLVVWFKDVPPQPVKPPASPAPPPETLHTAGKPTTADTTPAPATLPAPATSAPTAASANSPPKSKKPIDLSARTVEAHVLRTGNKNELEKVTCEGSVKVHQDPEAAQPGPDDKGVDIQGETLQMTRFPEGNVLVVTGEPAEVTMEKISIIGPEVYIDQKENKATVNGLGSMRLPSNTTFQGTKLAKPTELKVDWNKDMFFQGNYAEFHGGVQAEQDTARLSCLEMQVFLDRLVSLKGNDKGKAPAKVKELVCAKNVYIEDTARQNGQFLEYKRIRSCELSVDNESSLVKAPGPGVVYMHRPGPKGEAFPAPGAPKGNPKQKIEEELKLTLVTYLGRMWADNAKRMAIFYDNVEVVHLPAPNPDIKIDVDHLPPGGMYMQCQRLEVYSKKEANGTTSQEMTAHGKAMVHAQEFWGLADVIKYDESADKVIFEGTDGNQATLYKVKAPAAAPEVIRGKKILYWRKTNTFKVEDGTKIDATLTNGK